MVGVGEKKKRKGTFEQEKEREVFNKIAPEHFHLFLIWPSVPQFN